MNYYNLAANLTMWDMNLRKTHLVESAVVTKSAADTQGFHAHKNHHCTMNAAFTSCWISVEVL